jgi:hypothetical protein
MNSIVSTSLGRRGLAAIGALLLSACAGLGNRPLTPGLSTLPEVVATMGQPAMTWKNADGSQQLAFAAGPGGTQTFMVFVAPDGQLQRIVGVLNEGFFGRIEPGMSQEQVLRLLGPSGTPPTPFRRTGSLTWSWLFCQSQNLQQYFDVNFDAATGRVRSTGQHPWTHGYMPGTPPCQLQNIDLP